MGLFSFISSVNNNNDDNKICVTGETCGIQSQCWVLGGAHFYTFDGQVFEFQGNCTYTLVQTVTDSRENATFWVGVQKDRTNNGASSLKAIHVKVSMHNITIHRGEKGYAWVSLKFKMQTVTSLLIFCVGL